MSRKVIEKNVGSTRTSSPRAKVGSYPVLNPATKSKVGSAKLAKAVKKVWEEKKNGDSPGASNGAIANLESSRK